MSNEPKLVGRDGVVKIKDFNDEQRTNNGKIRVVDVNNNGVVDDNDEFVPVDGYSNVPDPAYILRDMCANRATMSSGYILDPGVEERLVKHDFSIKSVSTGNTTYQSITRNSIFGAFEIPSYGGFVSSNNNKCMYNGQTSRISLGEGANTIVIHVTDADGNWKSVLDLKTLELNVSKE